MGHIPTGAYFVRLDVKDFFMSGKTDELLFDATALFENYNEKKIIEESLQCLLSSQWVTSPSPNHCHLAWAVTCGTGMGLTHSGDVADISFLARCEADFAADRQTLEKFALLAYWRFKDDIILLATNRPLLRQYIAEFRSRARYFNIIVEILGTDVNFLDVNVFIENNKIFTRPFTKMTDISVPLSTDSAHPKHVHASWPKAMTRRMHALASTPDMARQAVAALHDRFSSSLINPFTRKQLSAPCTVRGERESANTTLWLKLGFHPALVPAVPRAITRFLESDRQLLARDALGRVHIRLAWQNCLPSLLTHTRR